MGNTTSAAFDPDPKYLSGTYSFKAFSTVLAGQVVGFQASGEDFQVYPTNGVTSQAVVGVALASASAGALCPVALPGSVVDVFEGVGGTIDAGDIVTTGAGLGCVKAIANEAGFQVGVALTDFAINAQGTILVTCLYAPKGA